MCCNYTAHVLQQCCKYADNTTEHVLQMCCSCTAHAVQQCCYSCTEYVVKMYCNCTANCCHWEKLFFCRGKLIKMETPGTRSYFLPLIGLFAVFRTITAQLQHICCTITAHLQHQYISAQLQHISAQLQHIVRILCDEVTSRVWTPKGKSKPKTKKQSLFCPLSL